MATRFGKRWLAVVVVGISAFLLANLLTTAVIGQGTLDQTLTGDPECNATNFRGTVSSSGSLRQEFVPSRPTLVAVEVCLSIGNPGDTVDVNIRSGTADSPGAVLASASAVTASSGDHFVRIDLPASLSTTPGAILVLEIPESNTFAWRGTCAEIIGICTSIDSDLYPLGNASYHVGDFAFRTFGEGTAATPTPAPDATPTPEPTTTPAPTPDQTPPASPAPSPTPDGLPRTGGSPAGGSSSADWLLASMIGLGLALLGSGAWAVARMRR